jgi:hypothetical protein
MTERRNGSRTSVALYHPDTGLTLLTLLTPLTLQEMKGQLRMMEKAQILLKGSVSGIGTFTTLLTYTGLSTPHVC